jgi:hypothetical protein
LGKKNPLLKGKIFFFLSFNYFATVVSTVAVITESTTTVVESTQHSFTDVESVFATSSAEALPPPRYGKY